MSTITAEYEIEIKPESSFSEFLLNKEDIVFTKPKNIKEARSFQKGPPKNDYSKSLFILWPPRQDWKYTMVPGEIKNDESISYSELFQPLSEEQQKIAISEGFVTKKILIRRVERYIHNNRNSTLEDISIGTTVAPEFVEKYVKQLEYSGKIISSKRNIGIEETVYRGAEGMSWIIHVFKETFESLGGTVVASVAHDEAPATSYTAELKKATEGEPEALVAISYPGHATIYLKEAIEGDFITEFRFVDGTKSATDIPEAVGAEAIEGMCGTAPGAAETESLTIYYETYEAEYGEVPPLPFMTNTYDAVIVAALAAYEAQVAGEELTSIAVRDHLRSVAGPPGEKVFAGPEGLKKALELLRAGQAIDYVGAAGDVDFDENGDVVTPIEVWCYENGSPVTQRLVTP